MIDTSKYDVIIGYRADDSYFSFARDFVSGAISYKQLSEAMHLGKLGEQVVLISEKAFQNLKYISCSPANPSIYYAKKKERDREARKEYRNAKFNDNLENELIIIDIIREEMTENVLRLR